MERGLVTEKVLAAAVGWGAEARLAALQVVLPPARSPVGNFIPAAQEGLLLHLAGQGPVRTDGTRHTGRVGHDVTVEQARADARLTTLNLISVLRRQIGSLDRVRRIVRVLGMVNAASDFTEHGAVMKGCSDVLLALFGGDIGTHAGSIIGMTSLPAGITVEIEMLVAINPAR